MITAVLAVALAAHAPVTPADLATLVAPGPTEEGKAALDRGRYAEAVAKLSRSQEPAAAYLRALALEEARRPAEAVQALERLEAALPDIADRISYLRGEALAAAHRSKEAVDAWSLVPDGSILSGPARLARARLSAGLDDRPAALAALAPLVGQPPPSDLGKPDLAATALLLEGRLRAEGGDGAAARRAYLACWSVHPLAPEAAECRSALQRLPGDAGAAPSDEDALRRAEALLEQNRNDAALALLGPLLDRAGEPAPDEPFACRVWAAAGRAHRRERNYRKAIEVLRPVSDRCGDPEVRVRALYVLAGAASIAGDKDEAVALYRRLARDYPAHAFADDALFFAADILARAGKTAEAREALAALAREHPAGDYRDEARFRIAWLLRRAGDGDAAIAQLLTIEESVDDPYEHARAAYWRARLLEAKGPDGRRAAREIWADLSARHPADYYGLLSRARLSRDDALPSPSLAAVAEALPAAWDAGTLPEDPHFRAGMLLLRLGLGDDAAAELAAVDPARLRESPPDAVLLVAHLLDRAGDHRSAHNLLRTRARAALRRAPEGENLRAWRIAYPPAYRDEVRRWAPAARVPVELVQALMREESGLDPRAVSPAGAIGLTQLMVPTAREVARQLKLGRVGRAELTGASLNIRLGARYLGELIRRFDGSVALALAAYNAGGGAVSRWLDQRRGLEIDEFVEEIPVEETRGYVKRVLRSYAAYRLLYGTPGEEGRVGLLGVARKG
jgi:soluble lytic murein transglycosylase